MINEAVVNTTASLSGQSFLCNSHHKKIAKQKDEVAERQQDLAEAKQKGDADKIAKQELKKLEARDY